MNRFLVVCAALLALAACAAPGDPAAEDETSTSEQVEPLYVNRQSLWPSSSIPVCWEAMPIATSAERDWVRQAVQRTWEAVSAVTFLGWGGCSPGAPGIHIRVADEGPSAASLGRYLNGVTGGITLNFKFATWGQGCQSQREFCIKAIATHEFGHALGFAHEQNRSDTPSWCDQEQGGNGDFLVGDWDLNSVMNYCNPSWNGNGNLSYVDVYGVQYFYGHRWAPNRYYRLTNKFLGAGRSLDTYSSELNQPFMGNSGSFTGQYWKITHVQEGYYRLTNQFLGASRSLDTYSGGLNQPFMGDTGVYQGQLWRIIPLGNGEYRFTNDYLDEGRSLDTYSTSPNTPFMATSGTPTGQRWQVTPL
jgi:hypothetical protein